MSRALLKILLPALAVVVIAGGCQRRSEFTFAPVEGTVTKDGRPLSNVQVVFYGDSDAGTVGPRASGITNEAGRYHLQGDLIRGERGQADGAVVGKHRVCVVDMLVEPETPVEKWRVPPSYGSINETPLCVEVHSGSQIIDLEVKPQRR